MLGSRRGGAGTSGRGGERGTGDTSRGNIFGNQSSGDAAATGYIEAANTNSGSGKRTGKVKTSQAARDQDAAEVLPGNVGIFLGNEDSMEVPRVSDIDRFTNDGTSKIDIALAGTGFSASRARKQIDDGAAAGDRIQSELREAAES